MVLSRARWVRDQHGTAVLEFAILTPVFLFMLMGMLAYGIYFGAAHALGQLAADAARTAIAGQDQAERNALVAAFIGNSAGAYLLIDPTRLSYEIGDNPDDPNQYVVRLRYDATELPIWNLYPPLPLPGTEIINGATIRRGGI